MNGLCVAESFRCVMTQYGAGQLKEQCRKLRPLIGSKADAIWLAYATSETP